jgi:hypothetical protein
MRLRKGAYTIRTLERPISLGRNPCDNRRIPGRSAKSIEMNAIDGHSSGGHAASDIYKTDRTLLGDRALRH